MDVFAALVSGVVVALATSFFTSRFYARQAKADLEKEFQGRFNERRWQVYSEFSDLLFNVIQASSDNRLSKDLPKFTKSMRELVTKLWLTGSDEVVRAFLVWRRTPTDDAVGTARALVSLVNVLVAMRRDLGDTDTDMTPRELLGTFVNDIDKYLDENSEPRSVKSAITGA